MEEETKSNHEEEPTKHTSQVEAEIETMSRNQNTIMDELNALEKKLESVLILPLESGNGELEKDVEKLVPLAQRLQSMNYVQKDCIRKIVNLSSRIEL